jgi:hypothetical protein
MSATAVSALFLTSPHSFALRRCDDGVDLLPLPLTNLLNLLLLLLYRERRVRAHRLIFLARLPVYRLTLLDRRLANARDRPTRFLARPPWPDTNRWPGADGNLSAGVLDNRRRKNDPAKQR